MKLSLYEIEKSHVELVEQLIENGGELTEELEEALKINQTDLQTKGINYGFVIKQLKGECELIDFEIKRLDALKRSRLKSVDRLENSLDTAMKIFGVEEIKTPVLKINFRKSETIEVDNLAQIDARFLVEKTTVTPDKVALKAAIKAGEEVSGARLVEHKNIQIK